MIAHTTAIAYVSTTTLPLRALVALAAAVGLAGCYPPRGPYGPYSATKVPSAAHESYDPAARAWFGLALGRVYVAGGVAAPRGSFEPRYIDSISYDGPSVASVASLDPATNAWRGEADLPTPRQRAFVFEARGRVWVAGGYVIVP